MLITKVAFSSDVCKWDKGQYTITNSTNMAERGSVVQELTNSQKLIELCIKWEKLTSRGDTSTVMGVCNGSLALRGRGRI